MARYIADVIGVLTEIKPISAASGSPAASVAWTFAADAEKIVETNGSGKIDVSLLPFRALINPTNDPNKSYDSGAVVLLDGSGRINEGFMPVGVGAEITKRSNGATALTAGMFVSMSSTTITPASNAAVNTKCDGFVLLAYAISAANVVVYGISNTNTSVTGLTANVPYYLGTNGAAIVAASLPTASGSIVQPLGRPSAPTSMILSNIEFFWVKTT